MSSEVLPDAVVASYDVGNVWLPQYGTAIKLEIGKTMLNMCLGPENDGVELWHKMVDAHTSTAQHEHSVQVMEKAHTRNHVITPPDAVEQLPGHTRTYVRGVMEGFRGYVREMLPFAFGQHQELLEVAATGDALFTKDANGDFCPETRILESLWLTACVAFKAAELAEPIKEFKRNLAKAANERSHKEEPFGGTKEWANAIAWAKAHILKPVYKQVMEAVPEIEERFELWVPNDVVRALLENADVRLPR